MGCQATGTAEYLSPTDCTVPGIHLRLEILSHTRDVICNACGALAAGIFPRRAH